MKKRIFAITPRIILSEKLPRHMQELSYSARPYDGKVILVNSKMFMHMSEQGIRSIFPISDKVNKSVSTFGDSSRFTIGIDVFPFSVFVVNFQNINPTFFESATQYSDGNVRLLITFCNFVHMELKRLNTYNEREIVPVANNFVCTFDKELLSLQQKIKQKYSLPDNF